MQQSSQKLHADKRQLRERERESTQRTGINKSVTRPVALAKLDLFLRSYGSLLLLLSNAAASLCPLLYAAAGYFTAARYNY
jgi:hypothetical protein